MWSEQQATEGPQAGFEFAVITGIYLINQGKLITKSIKWKKWRTMVENMGQGKVSLGVIFIVRCRAQVYSNMKEIILFFAVFFSIIFLSFFLFKPRLEFGTKKLNIGRLLVNYTRILNTPGE